MLRKKYICVILLLSFSAGTDCFSEETEALHIVHQQIESVWQIRQEITDLNRFGRRTMAEAMKILPLGESAVDPLVSYLAWEQDWMIRYWIVDLLGYFKSGTIVETLYLLIQDDSEELDVRLKAVESLEKQEYDAAGRSLKLLLRDVPDKKIVKKIRRSLKVVRKKKN